MNRDRDPRDNQAAADTARTISGFLNSGKKEPPMLLLNEWHFDFGLCTDGQLVSDLDCDELLEVIISWAVDRGFMIGGGFGPFNADTLHAD